MSFRHFFFPRIHFLGGFLPINDLLVLVILKWEVQLSLETSIHYVDFSQELNIVCENKVIGKTGRIDFKNSIILSNNNNNNNNNIVT